MHDKHNRFLREGYAGDRGTGRDATQGIIVFYADTAWGLLGCGWPREVIRVPSERGPIGEFPNATVFSGTHTDSYLLRILRE